MNLEDNKFKSNDPIKIIFNNNQEILAVFLRSNVTGIFYIEFVGHKFLCFAPWNNIIKITNQKIFSEEWYEYK